MARPRAGGGPDDYEMDDGPGGRPEPDETEDGGFTPGEGDEDDEDEEDGYDDETGAEGDEDDEDEEDGPAAAKARRLFERYKQDYDRKRNAEEQRRMGQATGRMGQFRKLAREHLGIDMTESGEPVIADREKFAAAAGLGQRAQEPAPAEEERPDPTFDPEGYERWRDRRDEARLTKLLQERIGPIAEENKRLRELMVKQSRPGPESARPHLRRIGLDYLVQEPEFAEHYENALGSIQDPEQVVSEEVQRMAALFAADRTAEALQARGRDPRARKAASSRPGLDYAGASRDSGGTPSAEADPEVVAQARAMGWPVKKYLALTDPTGDAYRKYQATEGGQTRRNGSAR